jgi:hypothetical protein
LLVQHHAATPDAAHFAHIFPNSQVKHDHNHSTIAALRSNVTWLKPTGSNQPHAAACKRPEMLESPIDATNHKLHS